MNIVTMQLQPIHCILYLNFGNDPDKMRFIVFYLFVVGRFLDQPVHLYISGLWIIPFLAWTNWHVRPSNRYPITHTQKLLSTLFRAYHQVYKDGIGD